MERKFVFAFILTLHIGSAFAQNQLELLSKLFQGIPVEKSYDTVMSFIESSSDFKKTDNHDFLLKGVNGRDFFIGSVTNLRENKIYDTAFETNSFSLVKAVNYSVNSKVFKDTLEITSITFFYNKDTYREFKQQFKRLNKLTKKYTEVTRSNTFRDSDLQKEHCYYYAHKDDELPFLSIEKQIKGYSKNQRWFILSVSRYRRHQEK